MDVASGYCEGCYRTIEEIADWGMMSDERKREVWQALRQRQTVLHPAPPAPVGDRSDARVIPTAAPPRRPSATGLPLIGPELPPDAS
jgi:predicted Fe-S protein YdhL (DUF1289 family)